MDRVAGDEAQFNKDGACNPASAGRRYMARRRRDALLDRLSGLATVVVERLHENWTPEQMGLSGSQVIR